jgi:hypothetical protein
MLDYWWKSSRGEVTGKAIIDWKFSMESTKIFYGIWLWYVLHRGIWSKGDR